MRLMKRGFTLIEILMVVIIIAIAAVVGVVTMSGNSAAVTVPAASRMVMADLSYAQNVASTSQTTVYVVLRKDGSKYTGYDLAYIKNPVATGDWIFTTERGQWITRFGSYGNGQTAPGPLAITQLKEVTLPGTGVFGFSSQGQPIMDNGGVITPTATAATFVVANPKDSVSYTISVAPLTGDISMK